MNEKLPIRGSHIYMSPEEIEKWWRIIEWEYDTHLKQYNVVLPRKNSSNALWLIFLKKNEGVMVHKDTISTFVNTVNPVAGRDQQVRHLAAKGWYVLNKGEKVPNKDEVIPGGYHLLVSTESPKPTFLFRALRRAGRISAQNFEQLKITYDNRCATCGSQENKPHLLDPDKRTVLQQGHMNPNYSLTLENSIPQCQLCNQIYQDDFVFDNKGRVVSVASIKPVMKADTEVIKEIKEALDEKFKI